MVIPLRDENPTSRRAVVTLLVIAANVAVFLLVQPNALGTGSATMQESQLAEVEFLYRNAMVPCEVTRFEPMSVDEINAQECVDEEAARGREFEPGKNVLFSVLASMFLHGGFLHIAGNMLFLWIYGNNVEDRLGPVVFLLFYLVTGLAASLAHVAVDPDSTVPVVGASGAIAGVMGAYLVWFPHARILSAVIFLFISLVRIPAFVVLGMWFVLQFFTNPNSGVAWAAHVGGFVAGAAIAFVVRLVQREPARQPGLP